ncbi:translesion DNA synthesis-associated protein ImuA [Castellaniella sp.]|uniref:translesion DNA synthesis-associated protein ImuA n=1 Tax=Castellaniella sp. TaxID=1955812 RepID=UPI003C724D48
MPACPIRPETIHPSLWRAAQLARGGAACVDTGHAALSAELPGGGWPVGSLTELLLPQPGLGELRLLLPVLRQLTPSGQARAARRSVLLIRPPHVLQPLALNWWGVDPGGIVVLRAVCQADACWAAEQALQAGTCRLVLLWSDVGLPSAAKGRRCSLDAGAGARRGNARSDAGAAIRPGALRRLNLAAQAGSALFFMFRPSCDADQPSPAPLRLALTPACGGVQVAFIKRRGPRRDDPLFVSLAPSPVLLDHHVRLDRRIPALDPVAAHRLRAPALHA